MYNYNRDVLNAEHERANRMTSAAERQVPYHMRTENWKRARGWLSENIIQPAGYTLSQLLQAATLKGGRYWRRSSSRVKGVILNNFESIVTGRA